MCVFTDTKIEDEGGYNQVEYLRLVMNIYQS